MPAARCHAARIGRGERLVSRSPREGVPASGALIASCWQVWSYATVEHRVTVLTLRSIAARIRFLLAQTAELDPELLALVKAHPAGPALLAEPGVGPVVAAQLLVSWSHRGRVRNEAAFAALAGPAPPEASSGQRTRHRLSRGGDRASTAPCTIGLSRRAVSSGAPAELAGSPALPRSPTTPAQHRSKSRAPTKPATASQVAVTAQLNAALHTVAITQIRTLGRRGHIYYHAKIAQGKTAREARRCLKRRPSRSQTTTTWGQRRDTTSLWPTAASGDSALPLAETTATSTVMPSATTRGAGSKRPGSGWRRGREGCPGWPAAARRAPAW